MARKQAATKEAAKQVPEQNKAPQDELQHFELAKLADKANNGTKSRFVEQAADKVVNPIVLARLLEVRPQMIYNYIKAGKIATVDQNNTQKLVIGIDEAQRFADVYLTRKQQKRLKVEAELNG